MLKATKMKLREIIWIRELFLDKILILYSKFSILLSLQKIHRKLQ